MFSVLSLRAYVLDEKSYPTKEAVGGIITDLETMKRETEKSMENTTKLKTEGLDKEKVKIL